MDKTFGMLFSDSIKEYGNKFVPILKTFVFLYLIPLVIILTIIGTILLIGLSTSNFNITDIINNSTKVAIFQNAGTALWGSSLFILFIVLMLIFVVFSVLLSISYISISFSKDNNITFSKNFKIARQYFWKYLGLTIILAIFLIFLYILLIVPGIIFTVYWIFASYILLNENLEIRSCLKRSKQLIKGKWWRTFGYMILIGLIFIGVTIITDFIPLIGGLTPTLVLTPFLIIFIKNLYFEYKKQKK